MKTSLRSLLAEKIAEIVNAIAAREGLGYQVGRIRIDYPPEYNLGHYASPVAMELSKVFRKPPRQIAEAIREGLLTDKQASQLISAVDIAGPGFLNITLQVAALSMVVRQKFSISRWLDMVFPIRQEPKTIVEFVSANPTGPLNIVSARAAAVGDSLCRILRRAGIPVHSEYYVNDYGNQVRLLGMSFAYRYAELQGHEICLPENAYQGEYIREVLQQILADESIPPELAPPERGSDLASWAEKAGEFFAPRGIARLVASQKSDLQSFRIHFDTFFHESTLHPAAVEAAFEKLKNLGALYEQEGAWFLASSRYGDDKDRVVIRSDGRPTYLMADIAYHLTKVDRGFSRIVDIWGPDHHGYIARLKGAMQAAGFLDARKQNSFEVLIVQQVNLLEEGKPVVMSKRLGRFQTMRDLTNRIPVDVCRYFFVTRGVSTHLDFDLEIATTQSNRNPVYYIQYAHARIHSIFRQAGIDFDSFEAELSGLEEYLSGDYRDELLYFTLRLPEEIEDIARNYEMQSLAEWLHQTATLFSKFYAQKERNNIVKTLKENPAEGRALLAIAAVTAQALAEGLSLLGIEAPREMTRDDAGEGS